MTALSDARAKIQRLETMVTNLRKRLKACEARTVWHGTNASTARPAITKPVIWIGTVFPTKMANGDLYIDMDGGKTNVAWQDRLQT